MLVQNFAYLMEPIIIGNTPGMDKTQPSDAMAMFNAVLDGSPGGGTPLCRHIREVIAQITLIAPQLRANGHRAGESLYTNYTNHTPTKR